MTKHEMKITKNGKEMILSFDNADEINVNGLAIFDTHKIYSSGLGMRFACPAKIEGKIVEGIMITEEQKKELVRMHKEVKAEAADILDDYFKTVKKIENFAGSSYTILDDRDAEMKKYSRELYHNKKEEFIRNSKKFWKEISRKCEEYESDVVIYEVLDEVETIKETVVRELAKEEDSQYKVNDVTSEDLIVKEISKIIDDVDYGKMPYFFRVFVKQEKITVKRN